MPPLLLAQKGIDWRVQCEHHKIQVFKSPENGTKTSHRYKIDHNRALKGTCDCLVANRDWKGGPIIYIGGNRAVQVP